MTSFKLFASQAQNINQYKNLRTKVAKCCANIYFNKQCIQNKVVPKYAQKLLVVLMATIWLIRYINSSFHFFLGIGSLKLGQMTTADIQMTCMSDCNIQYCYIIISAVCKYKECLTSSWSENTACRQCGESQLQNSIVIPVTATELTPCSTVLL